MPGLVLQIGWRSIGEQVGQFSGKAASPKGGDDLGANIEIQPVNFVIGDVVHRYLVYPDIPGQLAQ